MKRSKAAKRRLYIASDNKTYAEIYSIVLRGVICSLKSLFNDYYVSENIDGLMKYINSRNIIKADEYKRLLSEAKDFYPVIICAILIQPLRSYTQDFKCKELELERKKLLFAELKKELTEFFIDWLCVIDVNALLLSRVASGYNIDFNMQLCMTKQIKHSLTEIEERVLKVQIIEIAVSFLIEQVAIQLGLVGLDYIDYFEDKQLSKYNEISNKKLNQESFNQSTIQEVL